MKLLILFVIFSLHLLATSSISTYEDIPESISNEVESLKIGKSSHRLKKLISQVNKIKDKKVANDIFCQTCDLIFSQVVDYGRGGASKDSMKDFFLKLCKAFTDWGAVACQGYVDIEIDTVLYIINNKQELTGGRICGIYFQSKTCTDPNANPWSIPIPPKRKPKKTSHHHHHVRSTPLKILHLTDFHYDPLYVPGNKAVCDVPLCCQKSNGPATNKSQEAGYWGDYHVCDTPWHSIANFTSYLTNLKEKYDFVYYTGDIISHRSWATDRKANTDAVKKLFQHFNETFKDIPVYAILGNHEPHPTDFYSPANVTSSISTQWMFDLVGHEWTTRWLPSDANSTILKGGYYTYLIRPKLRLIALNSNVCFISNLWLIYEDADPYDQLKWLVGVLTQAEKDGEIVHILSHIPPGEVLCLQRWSNQFRKIVQRFAPIIAAQFNGHTHLDELRLFRDVNNTKKVVNFAFNAGSFTTFVGFNPNYRTYDVDPVNYRVLDYDHFTYNLTEANLDPSQSPKWYKLYSFKDAYGLKNITNESLGDLIGRMATNKTLVREYFRFQGRESGPHMSQGCNDLCLKKLTCGITAVETEEAIKCQQLQKKKTHRIL